MKDKIIIALVFLSVGMGIHNCAVSAVPFGLKFAVVDIPKVVNASRDVQALKVEQQNKMKSLENFILNAKNDIIKQTDPKQKQVLQEKYNSEFNIRKEAINKEYAQKLKTIDKRISMQIQIQAEQDKYDMVFAKAMVLYGGDDITNKIIRVVK